MALDYRACAQAICTHAGGSGNILSAQHCATRLRLTIADDAKVDRKALERTEGVQGVYAAEGQLQLILGTGAVNKVYHAFMQLPGMPAEPAAKPEQARRPLVMRILKTLGDIFGPILPAIVAAGLMVGLLHAAGQLFPAFAASDWYDLLDLIASTAFDYLPVLIAISAARNFGGNLYLGAVVGLCMVHADLLDAWASGSYGAQPPMWHLMLTDVPRVGYQGHVIPIVLAVWILCRLEQWLHRHVPEMLDLFVTPLVSVLVSLLLTFTVIGPAVAAAELAFLGLVRLLLVGSYGIGSLVLGTIYPLTVVCGLHHIYDLIEAGMVAERTLNLLMPIASSANIAQAGACIAVAVKTRDRRLRAMATPAAFSAVLGITEPAIYGINLRFVRPFVCAMAGGGVGAMFGALTGVGATAYGISTLPGLLLVPSSHRLLYLAMLLIAGATAFSLTVLAWQEDQAPRGTVIRCKQGAVRQPVPGEVIPLGEVPDAVFSAGMLGPGVGIRPADGVVYAPMDGTVISLAPTGHAVGLRSAGGMDVLIHIGIDTVEMAGSGFCALARQGDTVATGQKLVTFDRRTIRAAGHSDVVAVVLANSMSCQEVETGLLPEQ